MAAVLWYDRNSRLTIEGHADATGLRVRNQNCGQFIARGTGFGADPQEDRRDERLGGSNPPIDRRPEQKPELVELADHESITPAELIHKR